MTLVIATIAAIVIWRAVRAPAVTGAIILSHLATQDRDTTPNG